MAKTGSKPRQPLPPEAGSKKRTFRNAAFLFALALLVRGLYLYDSAGAPTHDLPVVDSLVYHQAAAQLAEGGGLSESFFFQPFLYPAFLSLIYWTSGSSILFARIVQIVLGSFTCLLTFLVAEKLFNRKTAWIAGATAAFYGPLIFFEAELLATGLAAFLFMAWIHLLLKAESPASLLLLGITGGLAVLARPTLLPVLIVGLIWLACRMRRWNALVPLLGFALAVLPVAFLNQKVTGQFGFLPSSGGLNLYVGNNPNFAETVNARPGSQWSDVIDLPRRHGQGESMWTRQAFFLEQVKDYASGDPAGFALGLGSKSLQFVSSRETPRNLDIYLFRRWSLMLKVLVWKAGVFGFPFGLLLPLAVMGFFFHYRKIPVIVPLSIAVYSAAVVLVFVASRYRVPVVPLLCIMAGAGITGLIQKKKLAIAGVATLLLCTLPGPFVAERMDYEPELHCCLAETLQQSGRIDEAIERFEQAIALEEEYADAHANVATLYMLKGRIEEAVQANERALEIQPGLAQAHGNLAVLLTNLGRYEEAEAHCEEGLKIRPHEEAFHFNLARICAEQRRMGEARMHLEKAIEINPRHGASQFELARFLEREGRIEDAIAHYRMAGKYAPDGETFFLLGNLLVATGRYAESIEPLQRAVSMEPGQSAARHTLALALANCGRVQEAVEQYREVLARAADYVPSLCGLSWLMSTHPDARMRDGKASLKLALEAARLDGSNPNVLNTLAAAYAEAGRFPEAVRTAEQAEKLARNAGLLGFTQQISSRLQLYRRGEPARE